MNLPCPRCRGQRGAATIVVMLGLLAALALGTLFANRGLLLEARMSSNQVRSTLAFEAAEAGLDWTLAQLNTPGRSGSDCRPDAAAAGSFRDRMLVVTTHGLTARTTADGTPMRAACARRAGAWACHCPTDAAPVLPASGDPDPAAFVVEVRAGDRPGLLRVVSGGSVAGGGQARVEAGLALLPAIDALPAAALTARGAIDAGSAWVVNEDPLSAGLVMHAGGTLAASAARVTSTAGSSTDGTLVAADTTLAEMGVDRHFVATFGLPRETWRRQPGVKVITCAADCGGALSAAAGPDGVHTMLWIEGDATLAGPLTLGQPDRPVVLVVGGHLTLDGPVVLHGLVYADGVAWQGAAGGALHGAVVSHADIALSTTAEVRRDASLLSGLVRRTGPFVRVPGSWRDF